jgi:hypothetical protein
MQMNSPARPIPTMRPKKPWPMKITIRLTMRTVVPINNSARNGAKDPNAPKYLNPFRDAPANPDHFL